MDVRFRFLFFRCLGRSPLLPLLFIARLLSMLSNEDKDQIRQLQQDHKEGLLSDLDFNSMRQTVVEQAQLRFVVEQTVKRQRIEQAHQSEEPRVPERIEQSSNMKMATRKT